jgi:hypothetical protein
MQLFFNLFKQEQEATNLCHAQVAIDPPLDLVALDPPPKQVNIDPPPEQVASV